MWYRGKLYRRFDREFGVLRYAQPSMVIIPSAKLECGWRRFGGLRCAKVLDRDADEAWTSGSIEHALALALDGGRGLTWRAHPPSTRSRRGDRGSGS